jgi:hypothetical protein
MSAGYIQLELGGKKRGIKFGNYALMEYSKINGTGVVEFNEENPIKLCSDLIYCGLKNNSYIKKEIMDFTMDDVLIWVDDMPMSQVTDVINLFEESVKTSQGIVDIQEAMNPDAPSSKSVKPKK